MGVVPLKWEETIGQRVRVYRNLTHHRMSVQVKVKGKGWRVVGSTEDAILAEVTFPVNETKRQYILHCRKRRDVCAWAEGILLSRTEPAIDHTCEIEISFNPFEAGHFFEKTTGRIIRPCHKLVVWQNRVFVSADALVLPIQLPQPVASPARTQASKPLVIQALSCCLS